MLECLEAIAADRPVLFPIHPRSAQQVERAGWRPEKVKLLEPQGYIRFLSPMASAAAMLTDSGGIQEETTVLGVPCLTLRANTERPVTVEQGTNRLLGVGPAALEELRLALSSGLEREAAIPEGWDGRAAERVASALLDRV